VKSDAGSGHLSDRRSSHHFTNAFHGPTYPLYVDHATCDIAECCTLGARATSTGSCRLTSRDAQPDEVTLFLPMPRNALAGITTALTATVSLREYPITMPFSLREINRDDQKRPVGRQDRATRGRPSDEEVRVAPRKPHPIHNKLRKMSPLGTMMCHQVEDSHKGTNNIATACCSLRALQTRPMTL